MFHSRVRIERCYPSDSQHQELFVVTRTCGCILNSRHMALRNLLFIYFASGNDPGRVPPSGIIKKIIRKHNDLYFQYAVRSTQYAVRSTEQQ